MARYIIKRILSIIPVLLGISIVVFLAVRLIPGDFATVTLGTQYTDEAAAALRERYGLDQPIVYQYFLWLGGILTGDFGFSYVSNQSVSVLLLSRLPVTLELTVLSLLLAVLVGIPMGYWAACKRNKAPDSVATVTGLLGISIPNFCFTVFSDFKMVSFRRFCAFGRWNSGKFKKHDSASHCPWGCG